MEQPESGSAPANGATGHITGIHHVQITIPEGAEERARTFYCSVLGLGEIEKPDNLKPRGGFWLEAGDRQVHVGVDRTERRSAGDQSPHCLRGDRTDTLA